MTPMHTSPDYDFTFQRRHNGPGDAEIDRMLKAIGYDSLDELTDVAIPDAIRMRQPLRIQEGASEHEALSELRAIAAQNRVFRSYLGMGDNDSITPPVILGKVVGGGGW
jgi:glycine dehydrogenase